MAKEGRKQLLILGAGVMQGPAIRTAREMGLETIVVDGDPKAPFAMLADRFEPIDLKDKEGIEALGRSVQKNGRLGGVFTAGTDFSATVAWVAQQLGLPGVPYEAALNASDKGRMRQRFQEAGVPSPQFAVLQDASALQSLSLPFSYPMVVKPVDNMGARGCRRIDSPEELRAALPEALGYSRSHQAILEEYMDGPEYSVDALIYRGQITICGLADRHIFFPPYFIEMGHTIPTSLADSQALLAAFTQGVRSLGLLGETCCGAAKGDVKLTSHGPMIGEIAARLSGGYMSGWTFPYASGVELTRGAISIALGEAPQNLAPSRSWTCAERAFISIPGTVRSIQGLEAAKAMPLVKDLFLLTAVGSRVQFPVNNVTKCGNVLAAAADRDSAIGAAENAARRVLIRLDAPDNETDAFLGMTGESNPLPHLDGGAGAIFPPPSFSLPREIEDQLKTLPLSDLRNRSTGSLALVPFPALESSACLDYAGRTVAASLEAALSLLEISIDRSSNPVPPYLGREFWYALVRGGYQGAAYLLDRLMAV